MPQPPNRWNSAEDDLLRREVLTQLGEGGVKDWQCIATKLPGRTNKDCRKRWHNVVCGGVNKGHWTQDEDKLLTEAVQARGKSWTVVATAVRTRNADQCAKRWKQFLDPELDRSQWTDKENKLLQEAHDKYGRRWKEIQAKHFPTRSRNAIKNQYTILIRKRKQPQINGIEDNEEAPSQSESEENGTMEARETDIMDFPYEQWDDDLSDHDAMIDGCDSAGEQEPANEIDTWSSDFCSNYSHLLSDATPADHMALDPTTNADQVLSQCFPGGELQCWDIPAPQTVQTSPEVFQNNIPDPLKDPALLASEFFPTPDTGPGSVGQNLNLVDWHQTSPLARYEAGSSPKRITLTVQSPCPETVESLMRIALTTASSFSFDRE